MIELVEVAAQYFDAPGAPLVEPDNGSQENRFPGARGSDKAHHFGAPDIELEILQHRHLAEGDGDILGPDGNVVSFTRQRGNGEAMAVAELDPEEIAKRRRNSCFVPRCLKPEIYYHIDDSDQTAKA